MVSLGNSKTLEMRIQEAIEMAHATCLDNNGNSEACAVAWDIVEELSAENSHQRVKTETYLQHYCDENPEADECRVYDL